MDAVFIFIFFLLMSAQFVDIYELNSDAPSIKEVADNKNKKPPLNLSLKISKSAVEVRVGLDNILHKKIKKTVDKEYLKELKKTLVAIKLKNIEEESIIFTPTKSVPYKDVIKIMDVVRSVGEEGPPLAAKNQKGTVIKTKNLFHQIIFET